MWIYVWYVEISGTWQLWAKGTRDEVCALVYSSAEAARLKAAGVTAGNFMQIFESQVP